MFRLFLGLLGFLGLLIYYTMYQSFTDVPVLIRNVATQFVLWKSHNKNESSQIARKVGLSKEQMRYVLDTYLTSHYGNMMIDLSKDTPAFLRKNIFEKIDIPEYY